MSDYTKSCDNCSEEFDSYVETVCDKCHEEHDQFVNKIFKERDELVALAKDLAGALEFYAGVYVWGCDLPGMRTAVDPSDHEEVKINDDRLDTRGGRRAREALERHRDLLARLEGE